MSSGSTTGWLAALILPALAGRARGRGRRGVAGNTAALVLVPPPGGGARRTGRRRGRVRLSTVRNTAFTLKASPAEHVRQLSRSTYVSNFTHENSLDEQLEEEDVDAGGAAEVVATLEVVTATLVVAGPDGFVQHKFLESQDWPSAQDVELDAPGD